MLVGDQLIPDTGYTPGLGGAHSAPVSAGVCSLHPTSHLSYKDSVCCVLILTCDLYVLVSTCLHMHWLDMHVEQVNEAGTH